MACRIDWKREMSPISSAHVSAVTLPTAGIVCSRCTLSSSIGSRCSERINADSMHKHIQHVLVEAAKLAPRYDPDFVLLYAKEKQKGNANRATLAVARKLLAYLLAVDREQRDWMPRQTFATSRSVKGATKTAPGCRGTGSEEIVSERHSFPRGIVSERSSPSRVRCAAKDAPLTAAGRSEISPLRKE